MRQRRGWTKAAAVVGDCGSERWGWARVAAAAGAGDGVGGRGGRATRELRGRQRRGRASTRKHVGNSLAFEAS